jgi:hypothetical protein
MSNKYPNFISQGTDLRKQEQLQPKVVRRKEIISIRTEIDETETARVQLSDRACACMLKAWGSAPSNHSNKKRKRVEKNNRKYQ